MDGIPLLPNPRNDRLILGRDLEFRFLLDRATVLAGVLHPHPIPPKIRPPVLQPKNARDGVGRVVFHVFPGIRDLPFMGRELGIGVAVSRRPLEELAGDLGVGLGFALF